MRWGSAGKGKEDHISENPNWYCVKQRAGPLVKECRSLRPRLSKNDTPYERTEKNKILRPAGDSSVCRSRVDRLELRLALFGYEGRVYTLTFDGDREPGAWKEVRRYWRSFLRRMKLHRGGPFDYVYLIEGRHGDHRYHIHLVLRDSEFSPETVAELWRFGYVYHEPLLRHSKDTYRRRSKYMNKEANDGVRIPVGARTWVCSKTLTARLPPTELFRSDTGTIDIPSPVRCSGRYQTANEFGAYHYGWYILPPT